MVPSSPPRPCSAMKARSNPCSLSCQTGVSAGSNGCASTPLACKAASTARPDNKEISRSALEPPNKTATLPKPLLISYSYNSHFTLQFDPRLRQDGILDMNNQVFNISCACLATGVHNEIGMFFRNLSPPYPITFQPGSSNQA